MPGAFDTGSLPGGLAADSGKSSQPGAMDGRPSAGLAATPDAQRNGQPDQESAPADLLPAVTLPKGGGAIRGLGEKLSVDAATGATSMTLPLPLSPGRSGFTPALSLRYDSTAGNGPFGFGWSIGLPAITRKTDKGLPVYRDEEESDTFLLAGSEDLVPVLDAAGGRVTGTRTVYGTQYAIAYYRPRIEGLFSRIERWTAAGTATSHWRTITRDNVTTLYGADQGSPSRTPSVRPGSSRGTSAGPGTTRATWRSTSTPRKTAREST